MNVEKAKEIKRQYIEATKPLNDALAKVMQLDIPVITLNLDGSFAGYRYSEETRNLIRLHEERVKEIYDLYKFKYPDLFR